MAVPPVVYEWLERWENHLDGGGPADVDTFARDHLTDAQPDLLAVFRERARSVLRFRSMFSVSGVPPTPDAVAGEANNPPNDLAPGCEPLPGYRLNVELGHGGFGIVWRATDPGGHAVAVKFVPAGGLKALAEARSFHLLCGIRHPNLITYHRASPVGRHLAIVMDLADRTVADRLAEAVSAGLPGIPRDELLGYMSGAAAALDFLNAGGQGRKPIQHRDVKPANLLLVGTDLKVADFGLARTLDQSVISHTGFHTSVYAAPEFIKNRVTSRSDQYSLAVVYCELRGGRCPFRGTKEAVINGHLAGEPDLSMLPAAERPVVRRALAKTPRHRWPSCAAFVAALRDGVQPDAVRRELLEDPRNAPLRRLYLAVRTAGQVRADRRTLSRHFARHTTLTVLPYLLVAVGAGFAALDYATDNTLPRWVGWTILAVALPLMIFYGPGIVTFRERRREMRKAIDELGPLEAQPYHLFDMTVIRYTYLADRDVSDISPAGAPPARTP